MARVIAVVSQKGGVGKTTSAINLAAAFAREGREVLLVEVDPQGAVLPSVGLADSPVRHSLLDVLRDEQTPALDAVLPTPFDGLSVIAAVRPETAASAGQEVELERIALAHPTLLREVIDQVSGRYDIVVLDGPPSLGPLLHLCLAASDSYLVPVQAEEYAYRTVARLLDTADSIREKLNPELECEGLLLTMVDLRTRMSVRVVNQLHENYGDKVLVSMVPRTVTLQDMPVRGRPTVIHASSSRGGKAYTEVAAEMLTNFETRTISSPVQAESHDEERISLSPMAPLAMVARQGEATRSAPRSLEEIGEHTMISTFPSTVAAQSHATAMASPAVRLADDDTFEIWGDDDHDRSLH